MAWGRGRAGARRRRCISDRGGAGKDQGTRMRPWVAVARPEMARGGPATRATAAADGDGPVRWRGSDLQRGARRLRRRQLGYSFLGRKPHKRERAERERAMAVMYSSALMAAAACSFGAQADKEREASEWELLRASAGPQIEEQGELASGATCMEATRQQADCTVGHEHYCSSNFKISILPRKYKLKSHFPPIISPKPIDYLLHRLHRCVGLQEYSNFP